jgi:hypothetical protein
MESPYSKSEQHFSDFVSSTPNFKMSYPGPQPRVRELYSDLYFAQANHDYVAFEEGLQKLAKWLEESVKLLEKPNTKGSSAEEPKKIVY